MVAQKAAAAAITKRLMAPPTVAGIAALHIDIRHAASQPHRGECFRHIGGGPHVHRLQAAGQRALNVRRAVVEENDSIWAHADALADKPECRGVRLAHADRRRDEDLPEITDSGGEMLRPMRLM